MLRITLDRHLGARITAGPWAGPGIVIPIIIISSVITGPDSLFQPGFLSNEAISPSARLLQDSLCRDAPSRARSWSPRWSPSALQASSRWTGAVMESQPIENY